MVQYVSVLPSKVSTMTYKPATGMITIETPCKMFEVPSKNQHYFELLVNNVVKNNVLQIDLNDKLSVPETDHRYEKCIAVFKRHVISIDYDKDDDGSVIITTDTGEASTCDCSYEDYKEFLTDLVKNGVVSIKIPLVCNYDMEIPDFSKIKKIKRKSDDDINNKN